jgi:hypothetical protein
MLFRSVPSGCGSGRFRVGRAFDGGRPGSYTRDIAVDITDL